MGHGCVTKNIMGMGKVSHGAFLGTAGKSVTLSKHYTLETVLKRLPVQGYQHAVVL